MIADFIKRIDPEVWKASVKYNSRPSDADLNKLSFNEDLIPAYRDRKRLWLQIERKMADDLNYQERAIIAQHVALIKGRFNECDIAIKSLQEPADMSQAIYYTALYPDMAVMNQMSEMRQLLIPVQQLAGGQ